MRALRIVAVIAVLLQNGCGSVTHLQLDVGIKAPPFIADYFPKIGLFIDFDQEVPAYEIIE